VPLILLVVVVPVALLGLLLVAEWLEKSLPAPFDSGPSPATDRPQAVTPDLGDG
jgi:hypothetical protein